MTSWGSNFIKSGENTPQDMATILTALIALSSEEMGSSLWLLSTVSPFRSHDFLRLSRRRGVSSRSLSVTWAPHLAATRPGTAVPAPSCQREGGRMISVYTQTMICYKFYINNNTDLKYKPWHYVTVSFRATFTTLATFSDANLRSWHAKNL